MGNIFKSGVPDNSAQVAEFKKQEQEAKKRAKEEKIRMNKELFSLRQRRFGRQSLIRNNGGELGVQSTLGQENVIGNGEKL